MFAVEADAKWLNLTLAALKSPFDSNLSGLLAYGTFFKQGVIFTTRKGKHVLGLPQVPFMALISSFDGPRKQRLIT